jgi:hypothetical protein
MGYHQPCTWEIVLTAAVFLLITGYQYGIAFSILVFVRRNTDFIGNIPDAVASSTVSSSR